MTTGPRYVPAAADGRPDKAQALRSVAVTSLVLAVISQLASSLNGRTEAYRQDVTEYLQRLGLGPEITQQSAAGGGPGTAVGSILGLAILVGLYLLVINGLARRRNWARVLGIVFAMISVAIGIGGLLLSAVAEVPLVLGGLLGLLAFLLGLVLVVVDIRWLVLAFDRRVADWYRTPLPG